MENQSQESQTRSDFFSNKRVHVSNQATTYNKTAGHFRERKPTDGMSLTC